MLKKLIPLLLAACSIGSAQNPYNTNIDLKGYFKATDATLTIPFVPVTVNPTGTGCTLGAVVQNTTTGALTECVGSTPTWSTINGSAITWGAISSGTNTTMAAICDTGCSVATTGTGSVQGTSLNGLPGVAYSVVGPVGSAPTVPSSNVGCWFNAGDVTQHCIDHTTNGSVMVRGLSTPASGTATCTPPQVSYDANYIYTCTSANVWASTPLSGFQGANNNAGGTIVITSATSASRTFTVPYNSAPICTLSPTSDPSGGTSAWWVTTSTTAVTANLHSSGTLTFNYTCVGNPN